MKSQNFQQMQKLKKRIEDDEKNEPVIKKIAEIDSMMRAIEETLYQTKNQSGQDPLNFPIRLNNKLAHLSSVAGRGDYPPTDQSIAVRDELTGQIDEQLGKLRSILETEVPEFNRKVRDKGVNAIITEATEPVN